MTIDEAIRQCEEVAEEKRYEVQECLVVHNMEYAEKCGRCGEKHRQLAEWLRDYKRLLEQEPCEDAISRQAVLEPYQTLDDNDTICIGLLRKNIEQQTSVTPQPKIGHWIDGKCSVCHENPLDYIECMGASNDAYIGAPMSYCPNCGAKMIVEKEKCVTCIYNGQIDDECAYCTNHHLYKGSEVAK